MSRPVREKKIFFVSHFSFRAWCDHCVPGKAKAMSWAFLRQPV